MSRKSNNQGRAYEFACLNALHKEISQIRPVKIKREKGSYEAAEKAWNTLDNTEKERYKISALAGIREILDLEPLILEDSRDILELEIQQDKHGEAGDVRDILISRPNIEWEVGLSVKHNHFAVKHSRLSKGIDFGEKWYNERCSIKYWDEVDPIFDFLETEKARKILWRDMPNKAEKIYIPLLASFRDEIMRKNKDKSLKIPQKLVEYLLGHFDFYKVISIDKKKATRIECYNLRGTLNKQTRNKKSDIDIPISELPTRIISFDFKTGSSNTLELRMDGGWQFNFRIHNASTEVEASLKFDVQIVSMPLSITYINREWDK